MMKIHYLLNCCFLAATMLTKQTVSVVHWFGTDEKYQCRCDFGARCDQTTGNCLWGQCEDGWFGPSCQYAKEPYSYKSGSTWKVGDISEICDINAYAESVTVRPEIPQPLTWIRIKGRTAVRPDQFTLTYTRNGKTVYCPRDDIVNVDSYTVEFVCGSSVRITEFILSGNGIRSLCSISISGGRNVAVRQTAEQSDSSDSAERAVDGSYYRAGSELTTCSPVSNKHGHAWWKLALSQPVDVNKIRIYNREDNEKDQLAGFTLNVYKDDGVPSYSFRDVQSKGKEVYSIVPPSTLRKVTKLEIHSAGREMTLCEVEVFGDSACESGKYGRECEKPCYCAGGANCSTHSGTCLSGCALGYRGDDCSKVCPSRRYGDGCSLACSSNCGGDKSCDHVTGRCLEGCVAGYTSTKCDKKCSSGAYGANCDKRCSGHCAGIPCHHISGYCEYGCDAGYTSPKCDQKCSNESYGPGCRMRCSQYCGGNKSCDHITGTCLHGCDAGHTRDKCDVKCSDHCGGDGSCDRVTGSCLHDCDPGYTSAKCNRPCSHGTYGTGCSMNCSTNCLGYGSPCDVETGHCLHGCNPGYTDEKCDQECPKGSYGAGCKEECSKQCEGVNSCHHVTGQCQHGCGSGYTSAKCDQACPSGRYGQACEETCSEHCAGSDNICNHVDGSCQCEPGYRAPLCDEKCETGKYGQGCEKACNMHCGGEENNCDHVTGSCDRGCKPGYHNKYCNETCPKGKFGEGCLHTCSEYCAGTDNSCHPVNGHCDHGCEPGHPPPLCVFTTVTATGPIDLHDEVLWITVGAVSVLLLVALVVIVMLSRRVSKKNHQLKSVKTTKAQNEIPNHDESHPRLTRAPGHLGQSEATARDTPNQDHQSSMDDLVVRYEEIIDERNVYQDIDDLQQACRSQPNAHGYEEPDPLTVNKEPTPKNATCERNRYVNALPYSVQSNAQRDVPVSNVYERQLPSNNPYVYPDDVPGLNSQHSYKNMPPAGHEYEEPIRLQDASSAKMKQNHYNNMKTSAV